MVYCVRPPVGGERVPAWCKNCGFMGFGTLAGVPFRISRVLKDRKCPKCGKKTMIMNPFIKY